MLNMKKKRTWLKAILICLLMVVIIGIPYSTSSAKAVPKRDQLQMTITYCNKMDKSEYTSKSWKAFQKELKEAKAVYKKTKEENAVYVTARSELETAKANLMFVTTKDKSNPRPYRQLTMDQIVDEMGTGWNLGNTMDGFADLVPAETAWQTVVTTKELIKTVHDMGFNTIRVPVTWLSMIDDSNDYAIDEAWISRVQDIVDYALAQDMYVIINIHHDPSGWLNTQAQDIDPVYEKFEHVWRNIANRFKDYDEHLVFEGMNEILAPGTPKEANRILMNLGQIFVNVVRSTGSNNSQRWLSVPARYAEVEMAANDKLGFELPADTVDNRLFVSVHHYEFKFGLNTDMEVTKYSSADVTILADMYKKVYDRFTSKGIPVILGEYGAVNKNNTVDRTLYYEAVGRICQKYKLVGCVWDNGYFDKTLKPDYGFAVINRSTGTALYPDIIKAILRGNFIASTADDFSDVVKKPKITKITGITIEDKALSMTIGDSKEIAVKVIPATTNEVVLWKTADADVASVYNGHVRARGIGTTTLTAFSQSGSIKAEVTVTVNAKESLKPCTSIATDSESYNLIKGKYIYMVATLTPVDTDDYVIYKSSDDSVATVSTIGKIVACKEGMATITVTSSNGVTKTVTVTVTNQ